MKEQEINQISNNLLDKINSKMREIDVIEFTEFTRSYAITNQTTNSIIVSLLQNGNKSIIIGAPFEGDIRYIAFKRRIACEVEFCVKDANEFKVYTSDLSDSKDDPIRKLLEDHANWVPYCTNKKYTIYKPAFEVERISGNPTMSDLFEMFIWSLKLSETEFLSLKAHWIADRMIPRGKLVILMKILSVCFIGVIVFSLFKQIPFI